MAFIKPMLARPGVVPTDETGWVLEPKHDGMRAIIEVTEGGVEIYSRTGKSQKGKCPHLESRFAATGDGIIGMRLPVGTILDGELAIMTNAVDIRGQKVPVVDFNKTMRVMGSGAEKAVKKQDEVGKIVFIVFDVIAVGEFDVTALPQVERFALVDELDLNWLIHNPRYTEDFDGVYQELLEAGVEGAILKHVDQEYALGRRAKRWLKLKAEDTYDVVVTGYTRGQGKYEGLIGAIGFGAYNSDGDLQYVGRCSGMSDAERVLWTENEESLVGTVIEVKANELVGSGVFRTPRHPQYVRMRDDKNAEECTMEQFRPVSG